MSENKETVISLQNIIKKFGDLTVLDDMSLDVYEHEVVVLCGPSGGGKSTLLRTINGLEKINGGKIYYRGTEVSSKNIKQIRKHIGMVFQQFNLFDNLTVKNNLLIAPVKTQKKNKEKMLEKAMEYLEIFGIADKLDAYPHQLSGGQKQRVAIVRSLMMEPDLMLFDEPTSALDPEMIKEVLDAMRRLSSMGMTMVIVTHEMGFAREVASRVCFLEGAKIRVNKDTKSFFEHTEDDRLQQFLSVILHH
ncbi:amino acid ABC transporter ATP-binding protein [Qiania dongpingensis]|uniref:Amino acid ABC transporter ATP-binding protein n=1 Tax=Qiania dongpingensis TaxID=2763669 RepID=A0A7G9G453_9FIRM|nr:amino acid ABC transporter ATP-binding protein [Qiania dongpingensis]QNM05585.1 amino acid ABC transporter ATP-binding protein [Qiania dongpingensis]